MKLQGRQITTLSWGEISRMSHCERDSHHSFLDFPNKCREATKYGMIMECPIRLKQKQRRVLISLGKV